MQHKTERSIELFIHDLNPWGGQDRSVLEIAYQLNNYFPLVIHSYTLEGKKNWPNMEHRSYRLRFKRPAIAKFIDFYIQTNSYLRKHKSLDKIYQSTGTAVLTADVFQIQFLHKTWQNIENKIDTYQNKSFLSFFKNIYHSVLQKFNIIIEEKIYNNQKKFIAISHSIKKELMENFSISPENIAVIHHGVDPKQFRPVESEDKSQLEKIAKLKESLNINKDDIIILHVGALNHRKGLDISLRVLSYLKKSGFANFKFIAVGSGNISYYNQLCKNLDITNVVSFISHTKEIPIFYQMADIFFFPSLYEPFGLVILEAMASGLAILTTAASGASELINDKENGLLIHNHKDELAIADSLASLLKNPELRKTLSQKARETGLNQSWEKVAHKYRDFYINLHI